MKLRISLYSILSFAFLIAGLLLLFSFGDMKNITDLSTNAGSVTIYNNSSYTINVSYLNDVSYIGMPLYSSVSIPSGSSRSVYVTSKKPSSSYHYTSCSASGSLPTGDNYINLTGSYSLIKGGKNISSGSMTITDSAYKFDITFNPNGVTKTIKFNNSSTKSTSSQKTYTVYFPAGGSFKYSVSDYPGNGYCWEINNNTRYNKNIPAVTCNINNASIRIDRTAYEQVIKYNANGGSGSMSDSTFYGDNSSNSLRSCTFTKSGYYFVGWSRSSTGSASYSNEQTFHKFVDTSDTYDTTPAYSITLYAVWRQDIVKLCDEYKIEHRVMQSMIPDKKIADMDYVGWKSLSNIEDQYIEESLFPSTIGDWISDTVLGLGEFLNSPYVWLEKPYYFEDQSQYYFSFYGVDVEETSEQFFIVLADDPYSLSRGCIILPEPIITEYDAIKLVSFYLQPGMMSDNGLYDGEYYVLIATNSQLGVIDGFTMINMTEQGVEGMSQEECERRLDFEAIYYDNEWDDIVCLSGRDIDAAYGSPMPEITIPSKTGHFFQGYYTEIEGKGERYYDGSGNSVRNWDKTSNTTLYAHWTPYILTLTLDKQGGSGGTSSITLTYNTGWSPESVTIPTKQGYIFNGYYTENGSQVVNGSGSIVASKTFTTISMTLYARWTPITYTVVFNGNGNTGGSMNNQSFTYDVKQTLNTNKFTKTGYHFAGWATSSGGNVVYGDGQSVTNLTATNNGTVNLYAKWIANTYTIKFDPNGGSGSMSDKSMIYDIPKNLDANTFTRQGYYFTGWSTSSSGAVVYKDETEVTNLVTSGSITLYAVWQDTWANHATETNMEGSGASSDPYIIDSAEDLAWMIYNHGSKLSYFKQTKAIDLGGRPWYPIGTSESPFMGVYDGQGFEITNLQIPKITNAGGVYIQSNVGMFGYCNGAEITGVYLKSATVYGKDNVGLLVSSATSSNINSNIIKNSKIYASGNSGAIAGKVSGGQVKYNLVYITTNQETLNAVGITQNKCDIKTNLIERSVSGNGEITRFKEGTDDYSGWGMVVGRLLPKAISWGAMITPAKEVDITNWIG